jgi:hypothetical protein
VIPAGEAGHGADVADDRGGDDRAHAEQPGQARPGRPDRRGELLSGIEQLSVDAAKVADEEPRRARSGLPQRPRPA